MAKRYLTLKARPKVKDAAKYSGSPSSKTNKEKKEVQDMEKLNDWSKLK